MKAGVFLSAVCLMALLGCSSTGGGGAPLIPDKAIHLTAKTSVSLSTLATAAVVVGAVYLVFDPLAPNWEIEEVRVGEDTYRFSMKMKRYHTGGAGESIQILKRRASKLQYEQGYSEYKILEYSESIDSQTLGAQRAADGVVRLVRREQADSFGVSEAY